nr:sulfite exporter TauE/SafE family protein 3 [Ipomoea batatas]
MCIWWSFLLSSLVLVIAEEGSLKKEALRSINATNNYSTFVKSLREPKASGHNHVWPELKFGWKIVVGSIIGFLGAAFGSVGGVGGGGIFVPMLTLVLRFDPKSATAISKCMITGAAVSTVYCNLRLRHPTMEMPVIDYDLAMLMQPMLLLGINIGVAFNVILADWMVTVLLILLFTGLSTLAFLRGVASWKKETKLKKEAAQIMLANGGGTFPCCPITSPQKKAKVCILENVYWKQFGLICFVWVASLALQITKQVHGGFGGLHDVLDITAIIVSRGRVKLFMLEKLHFHGLLVTSGAKEAWTWLGRWQLLSRCYGEEEDWITCSDVGDSPTGARPGGDQSRGSPRDESVGGDNISHDSKALLSGALNKDGFIKPRSVREGNPNGLTDRRPWQDDKSWGHALWWEGSPSGRCCASDSRPETGPRVADQHMEKVEDPSEDSKSWSERHVEKTYLSASKELENPEASRKEILKAPKQVQVRLQSLHKGSVISACREERETVLLTSGTPGHNIFEPRKLYNNLLNSVLGGEFVTGMIPVCFGVSWFEAFGLYKGWRKISSNNNDSISNLRPWQLIILCIFGIVAGTVGALLGLGGGFIMGPLFLELGVPPEVSTATSTFIMVFSSSIAVVEYYLLKRFPVPYAVCLTVVATFAAFVGQHAVRKVIAVLGRASLIIFTLAFIILISTISLGGIGISNMIKKIHHHENMGFESLCKYNA